MARPAAGRNTQPRSSLDDRLQLTAVAPVTTVMPVTAVATAVPSAAGPLGRTLAWHGGTAARQLREPVLLPTAVAATPPAGQSLGMQRRRTGAKLHHPVHRLVAHQL